ncbi:TPA: hypothetical protein ACH3X3_013231 [Trebouxia sp. C0006]
MIVIGTFLLVGIGTKLFSISDNFSGFQLLVSLLSTAKTDLGFVTSDLPDISQLENHHFTVQLLRIKGTAQLGSGSWVFSVQLDSGMDAMLKLNESPNEGNFLATLKGSANLVEMLGRKTCFYAEKAWQAILLVPVAPKLKCSDSSMLFCQVMYDVAGGIANAAMKDIAHRDITPQQLWTARGPWLLV